MKETSETLTPQQYRNRMIRSILEWLRDRLDEWESRGVGVKVFYQKPGSGPDVWGVAVGELERMRRFDGLDFSDCDAMILPHEGKVWWDAKCEVILALIGKRLAL